MHIQNLVHLAQLIYIAEKLSKHTELIEDTQPACMEALAKSSIFCREIGEIKFR